MKGPFLTFRTVQISGSIIDGGTDDNWTPTMVGGLQGVTGVSAGELHTLVMAIDGSVHAWGNNEYGQLGDGTLEDAAAPVEVQLGT